MNSEAAKTAALLQLIKALRSHAFSFDEIPQEQQLAIPPMINQHKLRSYFADITVDTALNVFTVQNSERQNVLRGRSEELCTSIASCANQYGLELAIIKGLSFEKCIYGTKSCAILEI